MNGGNAVPRTRYLLPAQKAPPSRDLYSARLRIGDYLSLPYVGLSLALDIGSAYD